MESQKKGDCRGGDPLFACFLEFVQKYAEICIFPRNTKNLPIYFLDLFCYIMYGKDEKKFKGKLGENQGRKATGSGVARL